MSNDKPKLRLSDGSFTTIEEAAKMWGLTVDEAVRKIASAMSLPKRGPIKDYKQ